MLNLIYIFFHVFFQLLDAVLGLLDTLLVFQDGLDEWTELVRVGLGVLLACAGHEDLELCAMATAKLHALVQTRPANTEEASYLLGRLDHSLQRALNQGIIIFIIKKKKIY